MPELDRTIAELPAGAAELRLRLEAVRIAIASHRTTDLTRALVRAERLGLFAADGVRHPDLLATAAHWRMQSRDSAPACAVLARRAAQAAAAADDLNATGVWLPFTCIVLKAAELFDEGITLAEAAQTWARDRGSPIWFAIAAMWRARFLQARGDLREAEADAQAAAAAVDSSAGWLAYIPSAALTEILLERGDVAGARAAWETMALGEAIPPGRPMTVLVFTRGLLRLAEGDTAAALRDLASADRRLLDIAPPSMNGQDGRLARALAHHATGDSDRARDVADEALQIARSGARPERSARRCA